MPQITINNCAGLYVQQNSFTVPDGAMEKLLNVICKQDQMAISRRGMSDFYDVAFETKRDPSAVTEYLDRIFVAESTQLDIFQPVFGDGRTAMSDTAALWNITKGTRPYFTKANGNLYATTANGVLKIESTSANIRKSGVPKGLDLVVEQTIDDGNDIFPVNSQVGYRILFGRVDANENKVIGAPSEFATATNVVNNNQAATAAVAVITVTSTAHGLTTGDLITTTDGKDSLGASQSAMNRVDTPVTVLTPNTFTYNATAAPAGTPAYTVDWAIEKNVNLEFTIPTDALSTEFFYQIYRTDFTSDQSIDPLESTLQLIYEANLSALEISVGIVQFTDTIDPIFKSGFLYTNPNTGEGILQANDPPPFADDIVQFNDMILYANTRTKYQLALNLVSVTNLSGNSILISTSDGGNRQYTGAASPGLGQFVVTTSGTTSQNIAATARSLCTTINQDPFSLIVAYYVSDVGGVPGKMLFESKSFDISFNVATLLPIISNNFQPILPDIGAGFVAATNLDEPNAIWPSKVKEPEAVPVTNKFFVGPKTSAILRVVPLRETCLVLTEVGVYGVRGDSPSNLSVQLIDNTVICKAKNSVQVINNECYFISNQGVAACSETSVRIVSRPIETPLNAVLGNTYFEQFTKAIGYESEHLYILGTLAPNTSPITISDTPTTASVTSKIATVNFNSTVDSIAIGDSVIITGMTGTLTPLNDIFIVLTVSGSAITFYINNANIAPASASATTIKTIGQNVIYTYNIVSNRWSQGDRYFIDGIVQSTTDKLILIRNSTQVAEERKLFNNLDYTDNNYPTVADYVADDGLSAQIDQNTILLYNGAVEAGDALIDASGNVNIIDSIDSVDGITLYFRTPVSFIYTQELQLYKAIEHDIVTSPLTAGDVSRFKFYSEFQAVFRTQSCRNVDVSFSTNSTVESEPITWESEILSGWGQLPFGAFDFGLGNATELVLTTQASENVRVIVPSTCSRASWIQARLNHKRATEGFDLQSFAYRARAYGSRVGS